MKLWIFHCGEEQASDFHLLEVSEFVVNSLEETSGDRRGAGKIKRNTELRCFASTQHLSPILTLAVNQHLQACSSQISSSSRLWNPYEASKVQTVIWRCKCMFGMESVSHSGHWVAHLRNPKSELCHRGNY